MREKGRDQVVGSAERILLVLGGVASGKSSFLKVIRNEAEVEVKPTYLLDYSYIRRGHAKKELIHCY